MRRGSRPSRTLAMAVRVSATTFDARSLIGISSSRIAGGISGRTWVIRRSSVRLNIGLKRLLHRSARTLLSRIECRRYEETPMRKQLLGGAAALIVALAAVVA